jgi:hypothetical protein
VLARAGVFFADSYLIHRQFDPAANQVS